MNDRILLSNYSVVFRLDRPATSQKIDKEHNERYHQYQVDERPNVESREAKQPQNQKHYKNCPQHIRRLLLSLSKLNPFWFY